MALTLYYHPLASFCWKPLVALYENRIPFKPVVVDFGSQPSRESFLKIWPIGEFPVLHDEERNQIVPQSSTVIEYLHLNYPGPAPMIPVDVALQLETRRWNEFFDTYIHVHMQKIVADVMRPEGQKDPLGVNDARDMIQTSYEILEARIKGRNWMVGDSFSMADCSACPALFYGNKVAPFTEKHPAVASYLERLMRRPSFAQVLKEAEPFMHFFPYKHNDPSN